MSSTFLYSNQGTPEADKSGVTAHQSRATSPTSTSMSVTALGKRRAESCLDQPDSKAPEIQKRWSSKALEILLDTLVDITNDGRNSENGFKSAAFHTVAQALQARSYHFNEKHCRTKADSLKRVWKEWWSHLSRTSAVCAAAARVSG